MPPRFERKICPVWPFWLQMTAPTTIRLAIICCVLCLSGGSTFAQDCPDQTQTGLNHCAAESYAKSDAALDRVYRRIVQKLKGQDQAAGLFVKAQKAGSPSAIRSAPS